MKALGIRSTYAPLIRRSVYFLSIFLLVKASAFLAPLLASNAAVDLDVYGSFEFSLTFGILASVVIDFGGNGAYPFYHLQKKEDRMQLGEFYFHYLLLLLVAGVLLSANFFFPFLPLKYELAAIVAVILGMQTRLSSIAKSNGQSILSVLADGGFFIVLNFYILYLWMQHGSFKLAAVYYWFIGYAFFLAVIYCYQFYKRSAHFSKEKYYNVLRWGSRIVVSSFLAIGLTGGARLLVEFFISTEEVGRYGFYFRLASFLVLLHQAVNIFFFKKIYTGTAEGLNRHMSKFLGVMLVVCLVSWLVAPLVLGPFFKVLSTYGADDQLLFFMLNIQVYYWISMAVLENFIYREDLAGKTNSYLLVLLIILAAFSFFAARLGWLTTELIALANVCCLFISTEVQYQCLRLKNIRLGKLRLINGITFLIFLVVVMIYWL